MEKTKALLFGTSLGAGAMYLWDPDRGDTRRAYVRDKAASIRHRMDDTAGKVRRDASNRFHGIQAEIRALLPRGEVAADDVLVRRIRSALGRVAGHPSSLQVTAHDGRVVLGGPILAHEVERVLSRAAAVRGVRGVENQLMVYDEPGGIPGLQGEPAPRREFPELAQANWSPAVRFFAGAAGVLLLLYGFSRRGLVGLGLSAGASLLAARAVTNREIFRLFGSNSR